MRTAIVTGAGSGIGRATALELARRGYAVALVGRTHHKLEIVAGEIQQTKAGSQTLCLVADVSKADEVKGMVSRVEENWDRIDVLVNSAGHAPLEPASEMSVEQWRAVVDINLSGVFYASREVWPIMRRQQGVQGAGGHGEKHEGGIGDDGSGGVIVNISSMASRDPFPGLGAYAAAKAGVNMLTLALAREGQPLGIRVVCIAPGMVNTPMLQELMGDKLDVEQTLPPEQIARMVGEAADGSLRFTSGETIFVHRGSA